MDELISFPLSRDERPPGQNIYNLYGKVRNAASQVIHSFLPEDQAELEDSASSQQQPDVEVDGSSTKSAPMSINAVQKSRPSVSISDGTVEMSSPADPIPLTDGEHSDVESMFSTASYSLSKTYLAAHYRKGRKRALNSLGREFWMKDENAKTCFRCLKAFTTFRRRHHCRVCGQIFCNNCTKLISGTKFHHFKQGARVRCCLNCLSTLSSQHSSSDEEELPSFLDDSPTRERTPRAPSTLINAGSYPSHHGFDEFRFSPRAPLNQSTPVLSPNARIGLFQHDEDVDEDETLQPAFFTRSRSNTRSSIRSIAAGAAGAPGLPSANGVASSAPMIASRHHSIVPTATAIFPISNKQQSITLNDASLQHLKIFLERVLKDSELSLDTWHQLLQDQLLNMADNIRVDIIGKERADPKDWIKLKRIPGGQPRDTDCLNGTVFTHNVALKNMQSKVMNPRVLLISFPLEYARGEERYMSLTPVLAQETEFLKKLVQRIQNLRPTVLLSSSHISGVALALLNAAGIVVATGISEFALQRLGRYISTEPLSSMDRLSVSPTLGACEKLEVRTYRNETMAKSYLFFTGLPTSGSTVLIRGSEQDTKLAKAVMEIMTDVTLSLKLETHLMRDQFVQIPDLDNVTAHDILSSSPFVQYTKPYLFLRSSELEDELVQYTERVKEIESLEKLVEAQKASQVQNVSETAESMTEPKKDDSGEQSQETTNFEGSDPPKKDGDPEKQDAETEPAEQEPADKELAEKIAKLQEEYPGELPGGSSNMVKIRKRIDKNRKDAVYSKWLDTKQQWEQEESSNPFMYNPSTHQSIVYSFFLYCNKTNIACVGPETCSVEFYLDSDIPLGQFVESICNTYEDPCPEGCANILGDHRRCYFHGDGLVTVKVEKQPCGIQGLQDTILMWNRCKICDSTTAFVPMSSYTWRYSFGKYLELAFWGAPLRLRASTCEHNIYRDCERYFSWHDMTIIVDYSPIELFEVDIPSIEIKMPSQRLIDIKNDAYVSFKDRIKVFWRSVVESLEKVQLEGLDEEKLAEAMNKLEEMRSNAEDDLQDCLGYLDEVYANLDPTDYLGLNKVLWFCQSTISKWHTEFSNFDGLFFPSEKDIRRVTVQQLRGMLLDDDKKLSSSDTERNVLSDSNNSISGEKGDSVKEKEPSSGMADIQPHHSGSIGDATSITVTSPDGKVASPPTSNAATPTKVKSPKLESSDPEVIALRSKFGTNINSTLSSLHEKLPASQQQNRNKVSFLARHFEELSQEFERERKREHQRLMDKRRAMAITHTQPVATVFKDVNEAVHDDHEYEYDTEAEADNEEESDEENLLSKRREERASSENDIPESLQPLKATKSVKNKLELPSTKPATAPEPKSLIRSLVNFWAERSSTRWNGIEDLLKPSEHLFSDSLVIIREDELSSLIAFCLSLPDYQERVASIYSGDDNLSLEDVMLGQKSVHLKYNFVKGPTTMSCKIFFSEQFDALRKRCGCSSDFIQSLSRCSPWDNSGGKSGSLFLKTADDMFILKSISQSEFDSWSNFAPSYFNYMSQALFHDLPTALAKILGVFQIHIRTANSNARLYIVVSVNLFASKKFTRFFDLKGSMRNRKAAETGKANEVLLDENMVDYIYENPVYVREHSKRRLRASIYNDTLFLTKMNVMDYSLVIAIDEETNTIVAGIIDYIRTFTWDKKVESWVKGRAAGGGGLEPTVISPKQYKVRFRESMEHYFLLVPDCWYPSDRPS